MLYGGDLLRVTALDPAFKLRGFSLGPMLEYGCVHLGWPWRHAAVGMWLVTAALAAGKPTIVNNADTYKILHGWYQRGACDANYPSSPGATAELSAADTAIASK